MTLPAYTVTVGKLPGAPYSVTTIRIGNVVIRSQLGPISDEAAREYVREYLAPKPEPRPFNVNPPRGKPGPKSKKSPSVNSRGFHWSNDE